MENLFALFVTKTNEISKFPDFLSLVSKAKYNLKNWLTLTFYFLSLVLSLPWFGPTCCHNGLHKDVWSPQYSPPMVMDSVIKELHKI